mgnify:CR=1 FL=1
MLELKNISFQVPDEKTRNTKEIGILKDVSLTLEDNQFVVITGPNGGGKSTLAKIIAGIEKLRRPDPFDRTGYYGYEHYRQSKAGNQLCLSAAGAI